MNENGSEHTTSGPGDGNPPRAREREHAVGDHLLLGDGPPNPDAELLAACAAFDAADRALHRDHGGEDTPNEEIDGYYAALKRVHELTTTTLAGLRAKAQVAHRALAFVVEDGGKEERIALSVLADTIGALA